MKNWKSKSMAIVGMLSIGLLILAGCSKAATEADPAEFYRGKTFTWIVSSGTAGGDETDLVARTVAPFLAKEIGATVRVENKASDEGVNYAYSEAKRDGLTAVQNSTVAIISGDVLKAPGVMYETEKFNFLADLRPSGKVMQIAPNLPHRTLDALRKAKGLKGGGTTAKGALALSAAVTFEVLGLDGKVISGYRAKKDLNLALTRGEVDFIVTSDTASAQEEADGSLFNVLVITKEKSRVVPNVPTIYEAGVKPAKELEAPLEFILAAGSALALTPEVPQDRVDYLRKVFLKISDNSEVRQAIEKVTGLSAPFTPGKELQDRMIAIKANKSLASQLDTIFSKYSATQ
ncbi:MAG: hypothetical protein HYY30_05420 [Chloroflexi bacterium]|nr:hypothetical protein [Chloroflexota bacterium]